MNSAPCQFVNLSQNPPPNPVCLGACTEAQAVDDQDSRRRRTFNGRPRSIPTMPARSRTAATHPAVARFTHPLRYASRVPGVPRTSNWLPIGTQSRPARKLGIPSRHSQLNRVYHRCASRSTIPEPSIRLMVKVPRPVGVFSLSPSWSDVLIAL